MVKIKIGRICLEIEIEQPLYTGLTEHGQFGHLGFGCFKDAKTGELVSRIICQDGSRFMDRLRPGYHRYVGVEPKRLCKTCKVKFLNLLDEMISQKVPGEDLLTLTMKIMSGQLVLAEPVQNDRKVIPLPHNPVFVSAAAGN